MPAGSSVSRILHDAHLQPHRQKMYLTSHDEEFREKRDEVLRVYYQTPAHEHIVCLDEETSIQALERRFPDIAMRPGQPVRREFEYVRHRTLCWTGAFDVRRGRPFRLRLLRPQRRHLYRATRPGRVGLSEGETSETVSLATKASESSKGVP
jgi:hypothetical protein